MASHRESKSIVSLCELDDESFSNALEQLSMGCGHPWNDEIQSMLEKSHLYTIVDTLEYYTKSLKVQLNETNNEVANWKQLNTMILSHLLIIKMKFYELDINLTSAITRLLEEVLAIYCSIELKLLSMLYSNDDKLCDLKEQFNVQSKQILSKLKHTFHWMNLNVVHCLLHVEFAKESMACMTLIKTMFKQILFVNTISNIDDISFCGYYLLFCKYQKLISSDDTVELLQSFLRRFNKNIEYLNNFNLLQEIQSNSNNEHQIVENYFMYIKDKEVLKETKSQIINNTCADITNTTLSFQEKCSRNSIERISNYADVPYWYANEVAKDDWKNLDNDEAGYESSKDERIVTLVEANSDDSMTEEENTVEEEMQDEKRTIFIVEQEEIDAGNNVDHQTLDVLEESFVCSKLETTEASILKAGSEHIKIEQHRSISDEINQTETMDSESQHTLMVIKEPNKELVETKQENVEEPDIADDGIDYNITDFQSTDNSEMVCSSCTHHDHPAEELIHCNNDTILSTDCENKAECPQNNLINQLREYLSISKPAIIDEGIHIQESHESQVSTQPEINIEPVNLEIDNVDSKPRLDPNKLKMYEGSCMNIAVSEEASKYLFEFGYETPPKDGTCEPEFHMVASNMIESEDMEEQIDNVNGFLTPENEIAGNMLPVAVQQYCDDGTVTFNLTQNGLTQYLPSTALQAGESDLTYEGTLDLSTNAQSNIINNVLDDTRYHLKNVCKKIGRGSRSNMSVVINRCGDVIRKYQCNSKLFEKLTMPSSFEENLLKEMRHRRSGPLTKSKKHLLSSLDMDIERTFADLIREKTRSKNQSHMRHTCAALHNNNATLMNANSIAAVDPETFKVTPVVQPEISQVLDLRPQEPHETITFANGEIHISGGEFDNKVDTADEDISGMLHSIQSGTEMRLPFKKRRMTVSLPVKSLDEVDRAEISYPATPMLSIAELAAVQPSPGPMLPAHDAAAYLNEMPLECQSTVGVEINYNLNAYPYNLMACTPAYLDMHYINAQPGIAYCDGVGIDYDSKENININHHYFRSETIEP